MPQPLSGVKPDTAPFRIFLLLWFGQWISVIGSGLTAFALGVHAYQTTGDATRYAGIVLAAFLPGYVLKPLGGYLADRFDRRRLMIVGDVASAVSLLLVVLPLLFGVTCWPLIFAGVLASSACTSFHGPATKAVVSDLVPESGYAKASGLMQLAEASRFLFSPLLAGFLLHWFPLAEVILIDIITFLLAALATATVPASAVRRRVDSTATSQDHAFFAGFRYLFAHPALRALLGITALITLAIGFLQALMGPLILAFSDARGLGLIQSLSATGMLAASLLIGATASSGGQRRRLVVALAFTGVFYAALGSTTEIPLLIAAGFGFFATLPFVNTALEVMIRKEVPAEVQGRVWSVISLLSQSGMALAFAVAGPLADRVFTPLLMPGGALAPSLGQWIGTGAGRGIGFMCLLGGAIVLLAAMLLTANRAVASLDQPH